jgi:hypothetical protein
LDPDAAPSEAAHQAANRVRSTGREFDVVGGKVGEHGLTQPAFEKSWHAVTLDRSGQGLIGLPTCLSFGLLFEARGSSDEDEAANVVRFNERRGVDGGMDENPSAHGITDVGARAAGLNHFARHGIDRFVECRRQTMSGGVDSTHGALRIQLIDE